MFIPTLVRPFTGRIGFVRALLLSTSVASFAGVASCSGSPGESGNVVVGSKDRPDNGQIAINESKLSGSISDHAIQLEIPVSTSGAKDASGTLNVHILNVEGTIALSSATASYALRRGESAKISATVAMPEGLVTQGDLVRFNVRVDEDAKDGLRVTKSLFHTVTPYEVRLEGPAKISNAKNVSYRVRAQNSTTRLPLADVPVTLSLSRDGAAVQSFHARTSVTGDATFPVQVDDPGAYQVSASAEAQGFVPEVDDAVSVEATGPKLLLTTDKPIYKPGQTLHLRALALTREGSKPIAAGAVLFEVEDAKGNKVFKKSITTDGYGVAASTFTLGSLVNLGTFKTRVSLGDVKSEKAVTVSQYALPKFDVAVKTDRPWYRPGEVVTGTIDARYFFGKLVSSGDVVIEAASLDVGQTTFQKVMGKLDDQGHFQFSITLPTVLAGIPLEQGKAAVTFTATVSDTAGQVVQKQAAVTVSKHGIAVTVVPESTSIVPGVENRLMVFVTDPLGNPAAGATVRLTTPDQATHDATTDAFGQAAIGWTAPTDTTGDLSVAASVAGVDSVSEALTFGVQSGQEHLVVRTDKPLYEIGDTVKVDIASTHDGSSIYVDVLNAGQAVVMRTLAASEGKASFTMDIDTTLMGSNRIEAYVVDSDGNVVRAGRTIFARNGKALAVSLSTDKTTYGPGQPAKLTFSVKDEEGRPAVAALGVQIVDQAVFALVDAHPGLLRTFFELEDAYAKPQYEIAAPSVDYDQILFAKPSDATAAQAAANLATASFAALGQGSPMGIEHGSWTDAVADATKKLVPSYDLAKDDLSAALHGLATRIALELKTSCPQSSFQCGSMYRGDLIQSLFKDRFHAADYWGNGYQVTPSYGTVTVTTSGPDEAAGTADDKSFTFQLSELDSSLTLSPVPANAGGNFGGVATGTTTGAGTGGTGVPVGTGGSGGSGASTGQDEPRVRQDFPETLYVNPAIITGPDGTATVDVNLADSITQWRVSTLANAADGRLGGAEGGVTVFQDFFVDINFPATLTRGDQVSFPIAVYNYLSEPQSVKLDLQVEDWFTPVGSTTTTVDLSPGQVKGVSFPVRVDKVGTRTLTVKAVGAQRSDAVARMVRVVPDGKLFSDTFSGMTAAGSVSRAFSFPEAAVPGSGQLYVEVYPAFLSQVVSGMDSILRTPSGCFEQTTSTTWPNVLVTAYLQGTKQITPEIQLKAESLISAGYQRLLTFEHPHGGFSWFGTQDPAPFLSVTAFGLMEFSDMAKVANVDPAMVARTRDWLVAQQQSDGSWTGDRSEFFSFQTSSLRNTAFVLWALASAGYQGPEMARGVAYVKAGLQGTKPDAYTLGIVANAFQLVAPDDPATGQAYDALIALAKTSGDKVSWDTAGTQTCFYGSGVDADVTSTALALQALLLRGGNKNLADGALKSITSSKDAEGNFGSTQATIWALRALLLAVSKGSDGAVGSLAISVDGQTTKTLDLTAEQADVMTLVDLSLYASGSHDVSLTFAGTGRVSYNAVSKYNLPWSGFSEPQGPLSIAVSYDKSTLYVNDTVRATVSVRNNTQSTENMILVTVGLPPGFDVLTDDFAPYLADGSISKFELTGKQLTLYVSSLRAAAQKAFSYRLRATMPVKATDGGGEAFLYYEPTRRAHAPAVAIEAQAN